MIVSRFGRISACSLRLRFGHRWMSTEPVSPAVSKCPISAIRSISAIVTPTVKSGEAVATCPMEPVTALSQAPSVSDTIRSYWRIYCQLSKYRLSSLVVISAGFGFFSAGGALLSASFPALVLGTGLQASCANTLNQVSEISQDSIMQRTRKRPLPTGSVSPKAAVLMAAASGAVGTGLLWVGCNPVASLLGVSTITLYAGAYTPLKMMSKWNTWIGAVVGAIPPVMGFVAPYAGWADALGVLAHNPAPWILGSVLLFWQMPHFYALSWMCRKDYGAAGYKMISVTDPSSTGMASLRNAAALVPVCLSAVAVGMCDPFFAVTSSLVNGFFIYRAWQFVQTFRHSHHGSHQSSSSKGPADSQDGAQDRAARTLFKTSLLHLPVLLALFVVHDSDDQKKSEQVAQAVGH